MTGPETILAIDQGSSSTRAILYDRDLRPLARADQPLQSHSPRPGWVEHSPAEVLEGVVDTVARVLAIAPAGARVVATGLANQGETVVAWDARTGRPLAPAVSWRCRRSEPIVERLAVAGVGEEVRELTGLPLDPYFSAGKMTWLLENVPSIASAAAMGRLCLGTVDAWLTHRLGGSARTDPSTASRTQLLGLRSLGWEPRLLDLFGVPEEALPGIGPTCGGLMVLHHPRWPAELHLTAAACDQPAALAGNAGGAAGAVKATFGTGVFVVSDAGHEPPTARTLEASVGWVLPDGGVSYIQQGGVLAAGSLLRWLEDDLGLPVGPEQVETLAASVPDSGGVRILPALDGLGAPWYRPGARVVVSGLTAATRPAHVARAALEAIAHRVCDVMEALTDAAGERPVCLRVDGGLTHIEPLMQRQADLLGMPVQVAADHESTARGVALLAAVGAGLLDPSDMVAAPVERQYLPRLDAAARTAERDGWRAFVTRAADL